MIAQAIAWGALAIAALNAYAILLILVRAFVWRTPVYRPMLLNIALSLMPVALVFVGSFALVVAQALVVNEAAAPWVTLAAAVTAALAFLAFFPNSAYLITELNFSHRRSDERVPLWYDIVQTLTLTLSGICNAIVSLALVQTFVVLVVHINEPVPRPPAWSWFVAGAVLLLGCFGVYMGRMLRLNSWDLILPWRVLMKLIAHLRTRGKAVEALAYTVSHAVLLGILYAAVYLPVYMLVMAAVLPSAPS